MSIETVECFLFWSFIINFLLFILWGLAFIFFHQKMYLTHLRWFRISEETFDTVHYFLMGAFKIFVFCFNLIPYLILKFLI